VPRTFSRKRALVLASHRRYSAQEKDRILETVLKAQQWTGWPRCRIREELGMPRATYYRWQAREREGRLADEVVVPYRRAAPPTPQEREAVCTFALTHRQMGHKRLTWRIGNAS
jgi:transposase-like protein